MKKDSPKPRRREEFVDDGRVIADMSVDGMPESITSKLVGSRRKKPAPLDELGRPIEIDDDQIELTLAEKKAINRGVMKAFLLFGGVTVLLFSIVFLLLHFFWLN